MTLYQKKLNDIVVRDFAGAAPDEIVNVLFEVGVIDHTILKILVIREFVKNRIKAGAAKLDAMWSATENFACSYEYVRKCVYYYKDVNLENGKRINASGNNDITFAENSKAC